MIEVTLTPNLPRRAIFNVPGTDQQVVMNENSGATLFSDSQGFLGELNGQQLSRLIISRTAEDYSEIQGLINEVQEMLNAD